jgi:tetratricopeptide (TPR) repeat protein
VNLPEGVLKSIHGDTIQVKVTKEGYLPESMVIPKATLASRSNLHFKLTENTLSKACEQKLGAIEAVSRGIAKAQSLTAKKNYERAEAVLLELQEDYPSLSVVYDLLGNVYYLQKNLGKALMAYEKSHELWPNNLETERMIRKLERSVSGSR